MNYWTGKRVLVTGGAGFIGHRVVRKLVDQGANVTVVDNLSKGAMKNLEELTGRIEFKNDDLLQTKVVKKSLQDTEICFHLAAKIGGIGYFHKTPAQSLRDNSMMNFNLWDAAIRTGTMMVCLSSSMVFERTNVFPTPESALQDSPPPVSGYGFSKLVAEYIARTYHEEFGVKYLIFRPFNAYGPGEMTGEYVGYAHVIPDLIKKTLSGQYPLEILGSGEQTRNYTYVDDVAEAIMYVTERRENDDFNIGTGDEMSVRKLAMWIWRLCGRKEPFATKQTPGFEHDVQRRVPDVTKIRQLGWKPKVAMAEGLATTIKWLTPNSP
ncbi:MAG TPA: SDR family NAD(P)-dependent oxidoreductase [Candidatus Bathyarchaeia archaeon]|nr:SDR family NAD(P)-dependent oxidoreductase [Candidatus Bathyarchaeia archaeon]